MDTFDFRYLFCDIVFVAEKCLLFCPQSSRIQPCPLSKIRRPVWQEKAERIEDSFDETGIQTGALST
jgi:hypothetical protein